MEVVKYNFSYNKFFFFFIYYMIYKKYKRDKAIKY